jgi:hypothetical protein
MTYAAIETVPTKPKSKFDTLMEQAILGVLLIMGAIVFIKEAKAKSNK